jgi:hypothetical protein
MTTNERLFAAGLIDPFDSAIDRGDRGAAMAILSEVEFDASQGAQIVDTIWASQRKYRYSFAPRSR